MGSPLFRLVVAGLLAAAASLLPSPAFAQGHPSPADWRDVTIYQVLTDRFFNGDPANDNAQGSYSAADGAAVHGGDWQGLTQKLDYIQGLGVNAVWISPVVLNAYGEYHGYAARDLFSYSPIMGGLGALQAFVDAAHARGLYVIVDIVANHMGDYIDSGTAGYPTYNAAGTYTLRWRNGALRHAAPFNNLAWYHGNGHIGNYVDPEQILGELFGLDDLKTETTSVRDALYNAYAQLIAQTDCDGFRIDTVKHAELGFWQDFCPRIRAAAAAQGKHNFLLMGEVFDGDPNKVGLYTGTMGGGASALNSATWFPMTFAARWVFSGNGQPSDLAGVYADSSLYDPIARWQLGNFFDNHDIGRLGSFGLANQDDALLRIALTWLLTSPGMPIVYYGTEQEYDGGGDPWNREDLWDGDWDFGPSQGDGFAMASSLYRHMRALQQARAALPALRRGGFVLLRADSGAPGVLAYRRTHAGGDALIVLNNHWEVRAATGLATTWPAGTVLRDVLSPQHTVTVGAGGAVDVVVPGRAALVLAAVAAGPSATSVGPVWVASTWPPHAGVLQLPTRDARLVFDRAMDPAVASTLQLDPPGAVQTAWRDSRTLLVRPAAGWSDGLNYTLQLPAGATAQDGSALDAAFSYGFRTDFTGPSIALPSGFDAEALAPFGMQQPLAIEVTPGGGVSVPAATPRADVPLISDVRRDRIYQLAIGPKPVTLTLQPTGDSITALELSSDSASLWATTPFALFELDAFGAAAQRASAPANWEAAASGTGAHAGRVYLSSPSGDAIYQWTGSALSILNSGLTNPRGMDLPWAGTGHPDVLVVCDPALGGGSGSGDLYRITAAGQRTPWVTDAAVAGVTSLAFAPPGPFGAGNLYALDALGERVLRIDAAGAVSVFATGFENLYGSDALAFGSDGDLYVVDPGGSESITNTNGSTAAPRVIRIVGETFTATPPAASAQSLRLDVRPNPFNPATEIRFMLPQAGAVELSLFDTSGRRVRLLASGWHEAGEHLARWDGRDAHGAPAASGVYHARLATAGQVLSRKLVLAR